MKNKILVTLTTCFILNAATQAQNAIPFSALRNPSQPTHISQVYNPMAAVHIPLYDSIIRWLTSSPLAQDWMPETKTCDFVYDIYNNLVSDVMEGRNGSQWDTANRYSYTYNAANQITGELMQSWTGNGIWVNNELYTYTYNSKGLDTALLLQEWMGGVWQNSNLTIYTYQANNLMASQLYELYDTAWENNTLDVYTYNANNLKISDVREGWYMNAWTKSDSMAYRYNANNLLSSYLEEGASIDSVTYYYNADSTLSLMSEEYLIGGNWWNVTSDGYRYDTNKIMLSDLYFNINGYYDSTHYYFHRTALGTNEITASTNTILIYPNPNKGNFTIENSGAKIDNCELVIYNVLGEKIYQSQLPEFNSTISISVSVPNGIYFLSIKSAQGVMNSKIVVQR